MDPSVSKRGDIYHGGHGVARFESRKVHEFRHTNECGGTYAAAKFSAVIPIRKYGSDQGVLPVPVFEFVLVLGHLFLVALHVKEDAYVSEDPLDAVEQ